MTGPRSGQIAKRAAAALAATLLLSGCGKKEQKNSGPAKPQPAASVTPDVQHDPSKWEGFMPEAGPLLSGHTVKPSDLSPTELQFGVAPKRVPGVTYKDDVLIMENGDKAIKSFASDGLNWTFDSSAPGVDQIQPGKIIFATSRCVGRVLNMQNSGGQTTVILGPVQLTDLIEQGNFSYDQPVDLNSLIAYSAPDYPGAPGSPYADQAAAAGALSRRNSAKGIVRSVNYFVISPAGKWTPMRTTSSPAPSRFGLVAWSAGDVNLTEALLRQATPTGQAPALNSPSIPPVIPGPPASTKLQTMNFNNFSATPCALDCGGIGLKIYQEKNGIKVSISVVFHMSAPHLSFYAGIQQGHISAYVELTGAAGVTVSIESGTTNDFPAIQANLQETNLIPIDISLPLGIPAVPITAVLHQSVSIKSGFSARNSELHGSADASVSGSLSVHYYAGKWTVPELTASTKQNLAQLVGGVSMGINSFVFSIDQRLTAGVGGAGFVTGPYADLYTTITSLAQSSTAAPCTQGTLTLSVGGGIGYSVPQVVAKVINFFLKLFHVDPIPATGSIASLPQLKPILTQGDQMPPKCASPPPGR